MEFFLDLPPNQPIILPANSLIILGKKDLCAKFGSVPLPKVVEEERYMLQYVRVAQ
ncbi:hypothetical protein YC2023_099432 [Brassica napus]